MTPAEEERRDALTAFIEQRVADGFTIESRTPMQAIIARGPRAGSFLSRFLPLGSGERHVLSVDEHGNVTTTAATPLRA